MVENVEPNVINEALTRACIQVEGAQESLEEKRKNTAFAEIETLIFSFRNIKKIDNLKGLDHLVKLQLDNNIIDKIEGIGHLVNLRWLDLSFNNIEKIEGLDTLTQLEDLSLHNNCIETIENLDALGSLNVLSIGNNKIKNLESNIQYLRPFRNLRLVNLAGNPICQSQEYRFYVLSRIKNLKYLDYRLVNPQDVASAKEQYQDEMLEFQEAEEKQQQEEAESQVRGEHESLMRAANMEGVESLFDDMLATDPEHNKLKSLREEKIAAALDEFRNNFGTYLEQFRQLVLEQHARKEGEREEWLRTVESATGGKDSEGRALIVAFEKQKKRAFRELRDDPGLAETKLKPLREEGDRLQDRLMDLEQQTVDVLNDLIGDFDRNYSELVDQNKAFYNAFFGQVRDQENVYFEAVTSAAMMLLEEYANGNLEDITDDARMLVQDKDTLLNAIQASHDAHTSKIDALEDKLVNKEVRDAAELLGEYRAWESKRNRDRISEIFNLVDRNKEEVEDMLSMERDVGENEYYG